MKSPEPLITSKVVAETTMFLRASQALCENDHKFADRFNALATSALPYARNDSVIGRICTDPSLAIEHATAHILLTAMGYADPQFDHVLREVLGSTDRRSVIGRELLPHHCLEHAWLHQIWTAQAQAPIDADLLHRTCIARPLDALHSTLADLYTFTHVVLYASDLGRRPATLPRPKSEVKADALSGLAAAVDADNFDISAELLWTWPMLGITWCPVSSFCFQLLAGWQDKLGFLPGPGFDRSVYGRLPTNDQHAYMLRTSYHTNFVMAFLCAVSLSQHNAPLAEVAPLPSPMLNVLRRSARCPLWLDAVAGHDGCSSADLSDLFLGIGLRRAAASYNLAELVETLEISVDLDSGDLPAAHQAVDVLRRANLFASYGRSSIVANSTAST